MLAELDAGQLLAIDDDCFGWSPARHLFFIDQSGRLAQYPAILPPLYPTQRIIQRYEAMVARYRVRPPATVLPPATGRSRKRRQSPRRPPRWRCAGIRWPRCAP
ncbi:hypothetical protein GGER_07190 [Serratia rubidaea]